MLKKLKSLFIVEDDTPKTVSSTEASADKIETAPEPDTSEQLADMPVSEPSQLPPDSKPDGKFVNVLLKAIDAANEEGFDYLEFKQSLQSLANMDMDEATRYQSAFAMAKTMGATPEQLLKSADTYLKVLDREAKKFKQALSSQRSKQVTGRESQLKDLQKAVALKKKKIQELTAEIEGHQEELGQQKESIEQAKAKVEMTNQQFQLAYQSVVKQITKDSDRMKKYLG